MTDDLSEFLLARITEEEETAKAAATGPWTVTEIYDDVFEVDDAPQPDSKQPSGAEAVRMPWFMRRKTADWGPRPPENVRIIQSDGTVIPVECCYDGIKNGQHMWTAIAPEGVILRPGVKPSVAVLPGRTGIRIPAEIYE